MQEYTGGDTLTIAAQLQFAGKTWRLELDSSSPVAQALAAHFPIRSVAKNIGGEIYFRATGVDIAYDGTETEEFQQGDVTYWRSPKGEDVFAIALFYGNTQYSRWTTPRASSPCIRIGRIAEDVEALKDVATGETVLFGGRP
jgi:hypothetical protein